MQTDRILIIGNCLRHTIKRHFLHPGGNVKNSSNVIPSYENKKLKVDVTGFDEHHIHTQQKIKSKYYDVIVTNEIFKKDNPWNTEHLRSKTSIKIISFPSIRFHGENPYTRRVHLTSGDPTPPQHFQDKRVYDCWKNQIPVDEIDLLYEETQMLEAFNSGIDELVKREHAADIKISDIIKHNRTKKLFTAFHHPTLYTSAKLMERIYKLLGYKNKKFINTGEFGSCDVLFNVHDTAETTYRCMNLNKAELSRIDLLTAWYEFYDNFYKK